MKGVDVAEELRFGIRDIPSCARYGFSARKIWVFFKTLVLSWIIWDIFVYLGFFAAGSDMAARWDQSRLLPLPGSLFWMDTIPVILLAIGIVLIIHVLMRGSMMVSRMTFQQVRGDDFFSGADASRFTKTHSAPLITIPVMLVLTMIIIFAVGVLAGVVSGIPAAGNVLVAVLSLPLWGMMLLGLLTAAGLLLALQLVPAVVATTGGDTFEAVFEVFSTLTSQSWRLFLYFLAAVIAILSAGLLFLLFSSLALTVLSSAFTLGAGNGSLVSTMAAGPQVLAPEVLPYFSGLVTFGHQDGAGTLTGLAGLIASISGTAVFLVVLSYMCSGFSAAWTLIYMVLKFRKDGEDLLERADREDQREFDRMYGETGPGPVEE
ncbi:MAG: hypothetical protein JXR55_10245 [Candidatus Fermentibacteraceae bacterium]|nr:hypothetical protein [Candidatus Fermentibacteraceae bacterium]